MRSTGDPEIYDVVIVGAGPAGLSAALVLGRMRRRVLVLDTGSPAHAVSRAVHGFLGQDGTSPHDLRRAGRDQLRPYPTVEMRGVAARSAHRLDGPTFEVMLDRGSRVATRRLLLAHGMHYGLPELPGVPALWGTRVFHCPYCHGWEVRDLRLAVYGFGERAVHQALLLRSLSEDVVVFCASPTAFSADDVALLDAAGVDLHSDRVERIDERDGALRVVLERASPVARDALFIQPKLTLASELALELGAELTDAGGVAVDAVGQSTVSGLYVAGDAATPVQSVPVAAGSGARAAYAVNASLVTDLARRSRTPATTGEEALLY